LVQLIYNNLMNLNRFDVPWHVVIRNRLQTCGLLA